MLTEPMLRAIHALLPGDDSRSYALRLLVRTLARNGGSMGWGEAVETLGSHSAELSEAQTWDGVRLTGCGLGATLALNESVRRAIGLPVSADDPLASVRAAVSHARNVSTFEEALGHVRYRTTGAPSVLPRDCPGPPP